MDHDDQHQSTQKKNKKKTGEDPAELEPTAATATTAADVIAAIPTTGAWRQTCFLLQRIARTPTKNKTKMGILSSTRNITGSTEAYVEHTLQTGGGGRGGGLMALSLSRSVSIVQ